ncbi:unnamed protein product [Calypogeia fissa]
MEYQKKMTGWGAVIGLLAVLLLLSSTTLSEAQSDPCKGVNCEKGQCVADPSQLLVGYRCNCDAGWSQITSLFPPLPCFLPNCTLNFSCDGSPAAAPAPALASPSGFLPSFPPLPSLSWCVIPGICGSGDCTEIPSGAVGILPSYQCDCHKGSSNLLNQTTGPCLPDCGVSGSCASLGIPLINSPPSSPSGNNNSGPTGSPNEGLTPSPISNPNPNSHAGNRQRSVGRGFTLAIFLTSVMWLSL